MGAGAFMGVCFVLCVVCTYVVWGALVLQLFHFSCQLRFEDNQFSRAVIIQPTKL